MTTPLLDLLDGILARATAGKLTEANAVETARRIVNSPLTALAVKATPNPVDDLVLAFLKTALPPR